MFWGVWQLRKDVQAQRTVGFAAVLPVFFVAAASMALGLNYNVRYVVISVIPCLVLVAVGIGGLRSRRLMVVATLAILAWYANGIVRRHWLPEYHNEDVAAAARWLEIENPSQQSIYVISDYMARTLRFHARDDAPILRFPAAGRVMVRVESQQQLQRALASVAVDNPQGCWFAVTRAYHGDPARLFRNWLAEDQRVRWGASLAGIELFHWTPSER